MSVESFYDRIEPLPESVEAEPVICKSELQIGHFKVDEEARRSGVGSETLEFIIEAAREECDVTRVDINIAYTDYPEEGVRSNDPSVEFLREQGFTITPHQNTVTGIKRLP